MVSLQRRFGAKFSHTSVGALMSLLLVLLSQGITEVPLVAAFQLSNVRFTKYSFHLGSASSDHDENLEHDAHLQDVARRTMLSSLALPIVVLAGIPDQVVAAVPMTIGEAEGLGARVERALRAKPPKALRPKLNLDFAVLLMRSSYNALDQIDCIAMVSLLLV